MALTVHRTLSTAIHVVENDKPPLRQLTATCGVQYYGMRYWGILAAKLIVAAAFLYGVWRGMEALYTPPAELAKWNHSPFLHDLRFTMMVFLFNLLVQGVLFLIIWDQRYRCRKCGRRLRMPILTGRYAQMLAVRSAEARVHLHLWARHTQGSGVAHHGQPSRATGSRTKTSGKSCIPSTKRRTSRRFRAEPSHKRTLEPFHLAVNSFIC